tara:strand:- start:190 stop:447 length:258 start_codon:yes stop_codon:yes gene_type:complete
MKIYKLLIEDEIPMMITYKFNLMNELIVCTFINVITGRTIPQLSRFKAGINTQYTYGMKILYQHINDLSKYKKYSFVAPKPREPE